MALFKKHILESDFNRVKRWPDVTCLGDDIILFDHIGRAPFPSAPRRMNFIVFGVVIQGSLCYHVDTVEHKVTAGQVIVVSERRVVDHYYRSDDVDGMCMMINVSFFQEIIRDMCDLSSLFLFTRSHPVIQLSASEVGVFGDYFHVIRRRVSDVDNRFRRELVRTLMQALFYDMSNVIYRFRDAATMRQSRSNEIFTRFIKMVEANCSRERRVAWYAEQMGITPKYLSESVKNVSKHTPTEWIDNYVTLAIRVQLKDTTKTIKDIAEEMNFPNQSFLGKYFRERVGMAPSAYRKG